MKHIRSTLTLACLAALAAASGAQGLQPATGITDIMRGGGRLAPTLALLVLALVAVTALGGRATRVAA